MDSQVLRPVCTTVRVQQPFNTHQQRSVLAGPLEPTTLTDIPVELLPKIVSKIDGILELKTRANVAFVNKAFAAAVREQQSVVFSSSNLIGTHRDIDFNLPTAPRLLATLRFIRNLQLDQVTIGNLERMLVVRVCCQELQALKVYIKTGPTCASETRYMCNFFWKLLHHDTISYKLTNACLRQMLITTDDGVQIDLRVPKGKLDDPKASLACITAGSIDILREVVLDVLTELQLEFLDQHDRSLELDHAMI